LAHRRQRNHCRATVVDPLGFDPFRLPKEIAFNAAAIALLAILATAAILGQIRRTDAPPFAWY